MYALKTDLLQRLGDPASAAAYDAALALTGSAAEQRFLERRKEADRSSAT